MRRLATARLALLCALLAGCALPGMHMEVSALNRVVPEPREPELDATLIPITPALIASEVTDAARGDAVPAGLLNGRPEDYRVGAGDILNITVWDHPELTIPAGEFRTPEAAGHLVGADGTIFYPYVGVVVVAGLTTGGIRAALSARLRTYIQDPQLDVKVAAYRSQRMVVAGEVKQAAVLYLTDRPLTLLEAINAAGGATDKADLRNVRVTRGGKAYTVDVLALYREGRSYDIFVTDRDQIHVPDRSGNKVYVMGEVVKPSFVVMENGRMNLAEALSAVSGINETVADAGQVYVIRGSIDRPLVYNLNAHSADAMLLATAFPLRPQDVVYVAPTGLARWNRVVNQVLPTVQTLFQTNALVERLND